MEGAVDLSYSVTSNLAGTNIHDPFNATTISVGGEIITGGVINNSLAWDTPVNWSEFWYFKHFLLEDVQTTIEDLKTQWMGNTNYTALLSEPVSFLTKYNLRRYFRF